MMRESGIVPPEVVGTKTMIDPWASWPRWPVKWAAIDGETKPILYLKKGKAFLWVGRASFCAARSSSAIFPLTSPFNHKTAHLMSVG